MSVLAHTKHLNKAVARSVFRKFNSKDDIVDVTQLPEVLIELGIPRTVLDKPTVDGLTKVMDSDGSGTVEFDEFFSWWSKMASTDVENMDTRVANIGELFSLTEI
jgi:Ca2+-binding EF-hand superfamily protein